MAQAIITKTRGYTSSKGKIISAEAYSGKISIRYDDDLSDDENHKAAAVALINKVGWQRHARGGVAHGVLPNGDHVHVFKGD